MRNNWRELFTILGLSFLLCLPVLFLPVAANAFCQDRVVCAVYPYKWTHNYVGQIGIPTCYKFGSGCRPWHCDGAALTNRDTWTQRCMYHYEKCTEANLCKAIFPGAASE